MRVIAGEARGRSLLAPKGLSTRPMMDIVKGSLFNMLGSMDAIDGRALDLYAGSGSLGIEALSRGVDSVDFVELDREACKVIEGNLERLGLADRGRVISGSVDRLIAGGTSSRRGGLTGPYQLVFVDAPYAEKVSQHILELLVSCTLLAGGATIAIGHHRHEDLPDALGRMERVKFRRFGSSCLSIYREHDGSQQD